MALAEGGDLGVAFSGEAKDPIAYFGLTRLNIFVNSQGMAWTIEYYSKVVEHFIFEELSDGLLARYVHLSERMLE